MAVWKKFTIDQNGYDLSHLDHISFQVQRPATDTHAAKDVSFFLSFSDHCFTDHYGENDDWIYPHARSRETRYFCLNRYEHSKNLPTLIPQIIQNNPYIGKTNLEHREQFFYLEEKILNVDYRIFFEINKNTSPNATTDMRINIASAYEPRSTLEFKSVGTSGHHKMWSVIDAKLSGTPLPDKKKR